MFSLPSVVARILKKYIDNGKVAVGEVCPNCNHDKIVYQEGCKSCPVCGWSKC
jgi:ribonucleoside-diphosphate reductase alpha chain